MAFSFSSSKVIHSPSTSSVVNFRFLEEYALNPDIDSRAELVKTCNPGTREYYLLRLRLLSQKLQEATVSNVVTTETTMTASMIESITKTIQDAEKSTLFGDKTVLEQFKAQFALLAYEAGWPDLLMKQLDFNPDSVTQLPSVAATSSTSEGGSGETQAEQGDLADNLPTSLDESLVDTELLTKSMMRDLIQDYHSVTVPALGWAHLMAQPGMRDLLLKEMPPSTLQMFFKQMDASMLSKSIKMPRGDEPGLGEGQGQGTGQGLSDTPTDELFVEVILRLYQEKKLDFSEDMQEFTSLTMKQLERINESEPSLMNNEGFVGLWEKRIIPSVFSQSSSSAKGEKVTDPRQTVHGEWIERMLKFVERLSPKFNRHKLAVYLMSLEYDLAKGVMDKDKFMRFIAIPKNHYNYNMETLKKYRESNVVVDMSSGQALTHWSCRVQPATKARDEEIVNEYLTHFLRLEKSAEAYEPFFELKTFLQPLLSRVMLTSSERDSGEAYIEKWSAMLPQFDGGISKLTEQTIIKFAHDNAETFLPEDPVFFKLKIKNASRILVRVFEVKTLEYLQQYSKDGMETVFGTGNGSSPVGLALNLDGLTPNWEKQITSDHPALEIHDLLIELPELADRRGAFVMDVISNGENSSAYFTKGYLDYVERQSVAGHVLTIIDEKQQKIDGDVSVWFNGYYHKTNNDGDIVIPYGNPSVTTDKFIYITHNDFTSRRPFTHKEESYEMSLSWLIDHESLIAGSVAKILIKANIQIGSVGVTCPVDLLEQIALEVQLCDEEDNDGVTTTISDFKLNNHGWSEYSFQVPENMQQVNFMLSAKIKVLSTGKLQDLSASRQYAIEGNSTDQCTSIQLASRHQTVQLQGVVKTVMRARTLAGEIDPTYEILVMGKNGEMRSHTPLEFTLEHSMLFESLNVYLRSDADGIIRLGKLKDITEVTCRSNQLTWELLSKRKHAYPRVIHGAAGEPIHVPCSRRDELFIRSVSMFRRSPELGRSRCFIEDVTEKIKLLNGLLTIDDLVPGYYSLYLGDTAVVEVVIANARVSPSTSEPIKGLEEFHVGSNPMLEIAESAKLPLFISSVHDDQTSQKVSIQIHNWTSATRVCAVATKFVPHKPMFEEMAVMGFEMPWSKEQAKQTPTAFRTGRVLGEEYQYILNRKSQAKHWAGNLLTKPSVLLSPWSIGDTSMAKQEMADQNLNAASSRVSAFNSAGGSGGRGFGLGKGGAMRHRRILPPGAPPLLPFLVNQSVILENLIPDYATGLIEIPYTELKEGNYLQIFVTDGAQAIQQSLAVANQEGGKLEYQKRDLRFKSPLDHERHYIGERTGISLDPKLATNKAGGGAVQPHSIKLTSNGSTASAVRVINSVSQVYDLMMTLLETEAQKQSLRSFGFIVDWHRFSTAVKNEKFSKWNCHQLNLFLYKKDREYFEAVVKPFIKNKLVKSFVDDYLIGAPLERYTGLKEFGLLTCLEKCLLAHRIPRLRSSVAQWIRSRVRNTKVASDVKLFRTVMKSGAVETVEGSVQEPAGDGFGSGEFLDLEPEADSDKDKDDYVLEFGVGDWSASGSWSCSQPGPNPGLSATDSALPPPPTAASFFSAPLRNVGFGQAAFGTPAPSNSAPGQSLFGSSSVNATNSLQATPTVSAFGGFGAMRAPSFQQQQQQQQQQTQQTQQTQQQQTQQQQMQQMQQARDQSEQLLQQQFKTVDLTKEMAETYYWGRQDQSVETEAKDVNAFWLDLVMWSQEEESKGASFLSQNFVANTKTFTSAMATLALLDVTFKPKEASVRRSSEGHLVVSSLSPAIVFHSSTKELIETPVTGSVLVTQQYFEQLERTEYDSKLMTNVRRYIHPSSEFQPSESYGAHVVLMNATSNPMKLHLEVELPQGSIPIYNLLESGQDVELAAHGTFQYEYRFYFPVEGDFTHYPAHISDYEDIIAYASPSVLKVRQCQPGQVLNTIDTTSWNYVLTRGTQEDVLAKLKTDRLDGMKVEMLIPRLYRDKAFLKSVTAILRDRHEYVDRIWSVSLVLKANESQDPKEKDEVLRLVSEYVTMKPVARKVGDWFTSKLVTRRPQSRYESAVSKTAFHYLEYFPLINARAHKASKHATILNDRFKIQYERFLILLSQKPRHDAEDLLVLIVYFLAQDRILEAKQYFLKLSVLVQEGRLESRDGNDQETNFQQIQYDYLRAYLSLCVEVHADAADGAASSLALDLKGVQAIVNKYQQYPVQRWNKLFKDMKIYVDEIVRSELSSVGEEDGVLVTAIQESASPATSINPSHDAVSKKSAKNKKTIPVTVDFKIESDNQITIHHRGVEEVIVEYYAIDAETMFSASPLTFSDQGQSETNVAANNRPSAASIHAHSPNRVTPSTGTAADSISYRLVKPNGVDKHSILSTEAEDEGLGQEGGVLRVPILAKYKNTNVMVSVATVPPAVTKTWKAYYSQTISVQCQELSGTIRVVTKLAPAEAPASGATAAVSTTSVSTARYSNALEQPIRGGYVKVYAEMKQGQNQTVFWKDGYTDLVGRFNYATVSTATGFDSSPPSFTGGKIVGGGLADVKRFVVFVDGGKEGCVVKTVPVPPV